MKTARRFRRTTILAIFCLGCLTGLGLARWLQFDVVPLVLFAVLSIPLLRRKTFALLVVAVLLSVSLGGWRGTEYFSRLRAYALLERRPVILRVVAVTDAVYAEKSQLSFDAVDVRVVDPIEGNLPGRISVKGFGEPMIYAGDVVQVEGKMFPTRGSRQAVVSFADLRVVSRSSSKLGEVRRRFSAALVSVLPEPLGSFSLGLLIGQRTTLPKAFTEQLSVTGLTHIVAVSGYNLTIIIVFARRLLAKRSRYQALLASVALIVLFVLLTGASASIVRASLVSLLALWAWYFGRAVKPILLIALVAAMTAMWYPIYLWSDLGWYLSFLAFYGILVLAPLVEKRFFHRQPRLIGRVFIETFCAQIMTLPLIMYIFGRLSLISFLANVLVVPLVPLAMLLSFTAGLAGLAWPILGGWFAWPARLVLGYMVEVINLLAGVPRASVVRYTSLWQMLVLYAVLMGLCLIIWRAVLRNGKITDRK